MVPQTAELPGAPVWSPGDEDVLTVNVWTPGFGGGDGLRPVLVWIHGGAYTFGSSAQPDYGGAALASAGLVVVSCNYRLGLEGFGHVPGQPANRGLLDQVAALRWVRANIPAFGGDPRNVTVAGQSAGAGSAACLMAMDRARGLFQRVIAHSVPHAYGTVSAAEAITERIAAAAGVGPTAGELRSATPQALVLAADQVASSWGADPASGALRHNAVLFGPVVDGDVLPAAPLSLSPDPTVDLLVCHATEEWWLMHQVGSALPVTTEENWPTRQRTWGCPPLWWPDTGSCCPMRRCPMSTSR